MAMKSSGFVIEQFNGHNDFTLWQQRVKNILTREGLIKALMKKKSEKPAGVTDDKWEEMRELANSTIQLYLGNNTLREVINETDPYELWMKLESRYKSKSLTSRLFLKQQLYVLHMAEGKDLMEHLDEFNRILTEMVAIGAKIEEEDQAILLLVSLPPSYEHIKTTLMYGKDTIKLDEVVATLISHESVRKKESDKTQLEGIMATSEGSQDRGRRQEKEAHRRGRSKSRGKDYKPRCFFCSQEGHIQKYCEKYKAAKKMNQPSEAAIIQKSDNDENPVDVLTVTSGHEKSDWILDSGSSFHICAAREMFETYQACDGGTVKMANNSMSKVVGMGTVKFRKLDGRILALTGVRHVPDLRKNLISLGMLDSKGCRVSIQGGEIEVMSTTNKIVLRGKLVDGLYKLEGNVLTNGSSVKQETRSIDRRDTHVERMNEQGKQLRRCTKNGREEARGGRAKAFKRKTMKVQATRELQVVQIGDPVKVIETHVKIDDPPLMKTLMKKTSAEVKRKRVSFALDLDGGGLSSDVRAGGEAGPPRSPK